MPLLHNRISHKELKEKLYVETEPRTTISFYKYFTIDNPTVFRDELYKKLTAFKVFGRIYVANEGINAQVSVPTSLFDSFKQCLYEYAELNGLRLNIAVDDDGKSFWVLKIKVREKIVADGINDENFTIDNKGEYVNAEQMNALIEQGNAVLVDMRNHYEYEVGHFEQAIEVPADTFRQQLPMAIDMLKGNEDKPIVMYCTGGIRCEKASAYLKHKGFKNVFHLEGGIINYAQQIKEKQLPSKFIGKNFVFDDRLGERITPDIIAQCHQCGQPCDDHTNCKNDGCHLLFIQCPSCREKYEGCCSSTCKETIQQPVERQKQLRKGQDKGRNIFNKSKERLRPHLKELIAQNQVSLE